MIYGESTRTCPNKGMKNSNGRGSLIFPPIMASKESTTPMARPMKQPHPAAFSVFVTLSPMSILLRSC